jgi:hypothetical protein
MSMRVKQAEGSRGDETKAQCCPPFRVMRANESLHPDRRPQAELLESKGHGGAAAGDQQC